MKMGAHHTLEIELNNKLTLAKERLRATLYDHSHDAKGRVKESSQYIDVHWCHISFMPLFASQSYPFLRFQQISFSQLGDTQP